MTNIVIALGYAFCWGVGVTLTKIALLGINATTLLVIQLFSSALFLSAICSLTQRQLPLTFRRLKQGVAGIFEPGLSYSIGIFGLRMTTASNATLIASLEVIMTILFAAVFLKERLTWAKAL